MVGARIALIACLFGSTGVVAQYDDQDGDGTAVVVQNRKFSMGHEFTLELGSLPLDAFFKGVTGTARYTLHFDDFHAWEIAAGSYSLNLDTGLTQQLRDNFGVQPEALPQLLVVADSNYVMKPLYGKFSFFNRALIYNELFFVAGATVTYWSDDSFRPGPDLGAGIRFFVAEWFSLRFDIRHAVVFNGLPLLDPNATVDNVLYLGGGVSFNVGGGA